MTYLVQLFCRGFGKGTHAGRVREVGGGFNPNRFIETLKTGGIIASGCL